jgi:hypothetical protein
MSQNSQNSIITTTSGIVGGVGKVLLSNQLTIASISLQATLDVAFYAAISAIVGYVVKLGIDKLKRKFHK